ncbi:Bcr/CflA family drug resistance efflux transporter [Leptospira kobayashii]|uniref:Bcr/CflA family drug resistance efflux transporter n=1 Tax=Leptospira kobayashii TaxID=1917830 RepID=A0ABN6KDM0_9LEPT|nr:multidrug effflux MFS transporter [Leptospira kobayashii]BDA77759.1 Bcr/CflA family drug resistance efflux transporter [Leptospira kobayashii]
MKELTKKQETLLIFLLGALTAIAPFSIDMYLPSFPAITEYFKTDIAQVELSLTFYFAGIAVGQLFYGPLIDRFGRKNPLLIGIFLYALASIGCSVAPNIDSLIWIRLLQGLGGCVGMVAANTIVRDVFPADRTARVFSLLILIMGVAPMVAPTLGGIFVASFGWQFIFLVLASFSVILFFWVVAFLPTVVGPDTSVSLKPNVILGKYIFVAKDRIFLRYALAGSFTLAGLFCYVAGSPFVIIHLMGFSPSEFGIVFAVNTSGFLLGSQVGRILLSRYTSDQIISVASICLAVSGLLLLGSVSLLSVSPYFYLAPLYFFLFFAGCIPPNANALALQHFTSNVGSASAFLGFLQMFIGSVATAGVGYFHIESALPMAAPMAICALISLSIYHGLGVKKKIEVNVKALG